ncbi:hypothetical protein Tco_0199314 [Tanacetum coccineum]
MIASSESKNSSKNIPRFSSNDIVHNHYLDEARKKIQERDRNSKTIVMPSARFQSTVDGSKPKPRRTNQTTRNWPTSKSSCIRITVVPKVDHSRNTSSLSDSKHFVCSTCQKCVFNANHDGCITKFLKAIFTGHRFSPNKTSAVYEKTSPRSDLRWKPTGRNLKIVGLRWVPTRKIFASCISTSINVQQEQSFNLSVGTSYNVNKESLRVWLLKKLISQKPVLKWIRYNINKENLRVWLLKKLIS